MKDSGIGIALSATRPNTISAKRPWIDERISPWTADCVTNSRAKVKHRGQGSIGWPMFIVGAFAVSMGAGLETALSGAYAACQYFGWDWGKHARMPDRDRLRCSTSATW